MKLIKNNKQKDNLAKLFYDLSKIVFAILIVTPATKFNDVSFQVMAIGTSSMLLFFIAGFILDYKELENG